MRPFAGRLLLLSALLAPLISLARAGGADIGPQAEKPPRKVVIGTAIFSPGGAYPGLDARLGELARLVDEMASQAKARPGARPLDLAILPETAITATTGTAAECAIPLSGRVETFFHDLAKRHGTYILATLDLAEEGPNGPFVSNAAVLFDRQGDVAGIYRKTHPVAYVGSDVTEQGVTPGREYPVFDCDFGRLGVQICWDIQFDEGWDALAHAGAEIIAWPTASPATILPASRALRHRNYIVSSAWRDNATIYEPTGMVAARIEPPARVLVHEIDLSFAVLGWSGFLQNGEALRSRFGDRVGFHYSVREDVGLFWSNDPSTSIAQMVRALNGEGLDAQVARNAQLYRDREGESQNPPALAVTLRRDEDRATVTRLGEGAMVQLDSPGGLGAAVLSRSGDRWPNPLRLRLTLKGLESLRLTAGKTTILATGTTGGQPTSRVALSENGQPERPLLQTSPFWTQIRAVRQNGQPATEIPLPDGAFEIDLPAALFDENPASLTVEWIDFHR